MNRIAIITAVVVAMGAGAALYLYRQQQESATTPPPAPAERTPATLVVGCAPHDNAMLHDENRDAVAAGIQNVLLGATTLGLASFWSTPAITQPPAVLELCGFDPDDRLVGVIYLGWATQDAPTPDRPQLPITHITS